MERSLKVYKKKEHCTSLIIFLLVIYFLFFILKYPKYLVLESVLFIFFLFLFILSHYVNKNLPEIKIYKNKILLKYIGYQILFRKSHKPRVEDYTFGFFKGLRIRYDNPNLIIIQGKISKESQRKVRRFPFIIFRGNYGDNKNLLKDIKKALTKKKG